jgi:transglutaminase-like putative cysteine protease
MNSILRSEAEPMVEPPAEVELEVIHETRYRYTRPVEIAHHIAMLRPRDEVSGNVQSLLEHALHIEPPPPALRDEIDVYGNTRSLFSLAAAHESLTVRATSRVRVRSSAAPAGSPRWEACRDGWRYLSGRPLDAAAEFVFASPMIPCEPLLRDWARSSFPPGRPLAEAAIDLMHRLHADFRYAPASTNVSTPLLEAFEQKRGVCQDFAHILIGALRSLGLAARYVSGYLLTEPAAGQPKLQGADASHAWVAVALPRPVDTADPPGGPHDASAAIEWLELDPTNDCIAGTSHVRLAWGRDYADVTPLRGVIRGGGRHRLDVGVTTRRLV